MHEVPSAHARVCAFRTIMMNETEQVYLEPDHAQFVSDMKDAGLEVQHYRGRFFWEGPAVIVDDLQDALGATQVRCQWDNMGRDWVVYPRAYGRPLACEPEDDHG